MNERYRVLVIDDESKFEDYAKEKIATKFPYREVEIERVTNVQGLEKYGDENTEVPFNLLLIDAGLEDNKGSQIGLVIKKILKLLSNVHAIDKETQVLLWTNLVNPYLNILTANIILELDRLKIRRDIGVVSKADDKWLEEVE